MMERDTTSHDQIFKDILRAFFHEFLTLFLPLIAASIDPDDVVFLDPQTFTDVPQGRSRTADVVARIHPLSADDEPEAVLFHVEVQSQPDPTLDARVWEYNAGLRQRHGQRAISAALLPFGSVAGARGVAKVRYVETLFGEDYTLLEYWRIGLRNLAADTYVATGSPLAVALAALMRPQPGPEGRANLKIAIVRRLRDSGLDDARLFLLVNLVETYLVLDAGEEAVLRARLRAEGGDDVEATELTWADRMMQRGREQGIAQGREQGIAQGIAQGILDTKREMTANLLRARFGAIPAALEACLGAADMATLDALFERAATASSAAEMLSDS